MTNKSEELSPAVVQVPSKFNVHIFRDEIMERKLIFQVVKMEDSLLLYINDADHAHFNDMSLALKSRNDDSSIGTRLIGNFTEEHSKNVACKLSKKVKKAVFVSCNLEPDRMLFPLVEKRIFEEMKSHPAKF